MAFNIPFRHWVERRLYSRGFSSPQVRSLLAMQILVTAAAAIPGVALCWLTLWPLSFAAGAAIACFSFWNIARFAQAAIYTTYSTALALRLFIGFSARLILISVVLFALIVWLRAPLAPLLIGLGSAVAGIVVWGISRLSRKTVKEA